MKPNDENGNLPGGSSVQRQQERQLNRDAVMSPQKSEGEHLREK
jgi:hypothetical protein